MLGLLGINNLPQQTSAQGGTAIIDDRRTLGESLPWRWPGRCWRRDVALAKSAAPLRGFILYGPLLPAGRSAATEPLAFTIQDIANGLVAGAAAEACQV